MRYKVIQYLIRKLLDMVKMIQEGKVVAALSRSIRTTWKVGIYYINGALLFSIWHHCTTMPQQRIWKWGGTIYCVCRPLKMNFSLHILQFKAKDKCFIFQKTFVTIKLLRRESWSQSMKWLSWVNIKMQCYFFDILNNQRNLKEPLLLVK